MSFDLEADMMIRAVEISAVILVSLLVLIGMYFVGEQILQRIKQRQLIKNQVISGGIDLSKLETCAVCLEDLSFPLIAFSCDHHFHQKCGEDWIKVNNSCPICRQIA